MGLSDLIPEPTGKTYDRVDGAPHGLARRENAARHVRAELAAVGAAARRWHRLLHERRDGLHWQVVQHAAEEIAAAAAGLGAVPVRRALGQGLLLPLVLAPEPPPRAAQQVDQQQEALHAKAWLWRPLERRQPTGEKVVAEVASMASMAYLPGGHHT